MQDLRLHVVLTDLAQLLVQHRGHFVRAEILDGLQHKELITQSQQHVITVGRGGHVAPFASFPSFP